LAWQRARVERLMLAWIVLKRLAKTSRWLLLHKTLAINQLINQSLHSIHFLFIAPLEPVLMESCEFRLQVPPFDAQHCCHSAVLARGLEAESRLLVRTEKQVFAGLSQFAACAACLPRWMPSKRALVRNTPGKSGLEACQCMLGKHAQLGSLKGAPHCYP